MTLPLDENGQPPRFLHRHRLQSRSRDELVGICKGCAADGVINQREAEYLQHWLEMNADVSGDWPFNALHNRIAEFLEDGVLDQHEKDELLDFLRQIENQDSLIKVRTPTSLCFDDPMPKLTFDGESFCFTGRFALGTRRDCEREVLSLGGFVQRDVIAVDCTILVVGTLASRDWKHANWGTKITRAVYLREKGHPVSIISEDHWVNQLLKVKKR